MAYPASWTAGVIAAIARFAASTAATFNAGNHRTNFPIATVDLGTVLPAVAEAADYAKAQADLSAGSAVTAAASIASLTGTSATSRTPSIASISWTASTGKSWLVGTWLLVASRADATNYGHGQVSAYNSGTGALTVNVTKIGAGAAAAADWDISLSSPVGPTGSTGATGRMAGLLYSYSTTRTEADPGAATFRVDNSDPTQITELYISETDGDGRGVTSFLLNACQSNSTIRGNLTFTDITTPNNYLSIDVTADLDDRGGWDVLTCSYRSHGNTLANAASCLLTVTRTGDRGATGATGATGPTGPIGTPTAICQDWDAGITDANPGTGKARADSATYANVTYLYINKSERGAASIESWIAIWDDSTNSGNRGTVTYVQQSDPLNFLQVKITGALIDATTYFKLPVSHLSHGAAELTGKVSVQFERAGDAGAAGAGAGNVNTSGAPVVSGRIPTYADTTGNLLQDSGFTTGSFQPIHAKLTSISGSGASTGLLEKDGVDSFVVRALGVAGATSVPTRADADARYLGLAGGTMTSFIVLHADPSTALQAATKQYVDNLAAGLDAKASVLCRTTANITLSGEQTLDGQLTSASRVLVMAQTAPAENGIYVSAAGAWTRATDMDAWTEFPGAYVWVEKGSTWADTGWNCTVDTGGTLGTTAVAFVQFAASTFSSAGNGLTKTGQVFSVDTTITATLNVANTWAAAQTFLNSSGIKILDTNASHTLGVIVGSDLTDNRTLTVTTGDANRTLDISAGDVTISAAGAALINDASAPDMLVTLDAEPRGLAYGINTQTDSYTLVLGDAGKIIEGNKATAMNITVPLNSSVAFATNTRIDLVQYGAGQITVVATGGVTIRSSGGMLKLAGQYSGAALYKRGTDEWVLIGTIAS